MLLRNTTLGPDISPLSVLVEAIDSNILHVKIGAAGRWEVPQDDLFLNTGMGKVLLRISSPLLPCSLQSVSQCPATVQPSEGRLSCHSAYQHQGNDRR